MKHLKKYRWVIIASLFVVFITFIVLLLRTELMPKQPFSANISVVVYGEDTDRWRSFEQGLSLACTELGIETPTTIYSDEADPADQIERLQREIDAGAQGLIVAPVNSAEMENFMEQSAGKLPILLVESDAGQHQAISAANAQMGQDLAERVAADGIRSITLMQANQARQSVRQRYDAFVQRAEELGVAITLWESVPPAEMTKTLTYNINHMGTRAFAALDNETLERVIDAKISREIYIYGIGSSEKVVRALDTGKITAFCYQNEFTMGYISVMQLARQLGYSATPPESFVEYALVDKNNLYEPAIERLVFPILQ